ncbi:hypothetical protein OUZ56_003284 [Daphnia magna]|uniref:Helicase C-terminal domain-containing protein n=1 Tax=Daphnia magna TaxID=35525 RepID=A0ABR0A8A1_9CRUS|nr:hypothetical protein OUZ56_003284 [Daphnia magna]
MTARSSRRLEPTPNVAFVGTGFKKTRKAIVEVMCHATLANRWLKVRKDRYENYLIDESHFGDPASIAMRRAVDEQVMNNQASVAFITATPPDRKGGINHASANQRRGRVGRDRQGTYIYHGQPCESDSNHVKWVEAQIYMDNFQPPTTFMEEEQGKATRTAGAYTMNLKEITTFLDLTDKYDFTPWAAYNASKRSKNLADREWVVSGTDAEVRGTLEGGQGPRIESGRLANRRLRLPFADDRMDMCSHKDDTPWKAYVEYRSRKGGFQQVDEESHLLAME